MSKVVIIHGMNQQYRSELAYRDMCRDALRSGVMAARRKGFAGEVPAPEDIGLAFYGDAFRSEARPNPNGTNNGTSAGEIEVLGSLDGPLDGSPEDHPGGRDVGLLLEGYEEAFAALDRGESLPWPAPGEPENLGDVDTAQGPPDVLSGGVAKTRASATTMKFTRWFEEAVGTSFVADEIARSSIPHFHKYLNDMALAQEVEARLTAAITDETQVLVGHSMGTVEGYRWLRVPPKEHNIKRLVTLGPPLGVRYAHDNARIVGDPQRRGWPGTVEWHNVADPHDIIAPRTELAPLFPYRPDGVPPLQDHRVHNGRGAHEIERYLNAALTARLIVEGLS